MLWCSKHKQQKIYRILAATVVSLNAGTINILNRDNCSYRHIAYLWLTCKHSPKESGSYRLREAMLPSEPKCRSNREDRTQNNYLRKFGDELNQRAGGF